MIKNKIIKTISEKEMDRKEFLKYSGLLLLSLVGFRSFVNFFTQGNGDISKNDNPRGYGGGKYGA
jgi:hypothetical protein